MSVIHQAHGRVVRGRYHQAAIVFLLVGLAVSWLVRWLVTAKDLPQPLLGDLRFPVTVAGIFVGTALIWGAHRKFTWLVSLFVLYRAVVLSVGAITGSYLEVRPDPTAVVPTAWTDLGAVKVFLAGEVASATPGYELVALGRTAVEVPVVGLQANPAVVALIAAALLLLIALVLWRAAARAL